MGYAWQAFPDTSQERYLACPFRFIVFSGTRGPGKTEATLIKFHMHTGQGYGADWRGIIFAQQYKNLDDVVAKGKKLFLSLGIGIEWRAANDAYKFVWPDGAELLLRVADKPDDYWNYHGHGYPFVAWEELTKWSTPDLFDTMRSINRCSVPDVPLFYLATTNPYGAGHAWVKERFIDPKPELTSQGSLIRRFDDDGEELEPIIRFDGDILENKYLVENDPEYIRELDNLPNEALRRAWRYGDWEVNVGAYFHGYLSKENNMIQPFTPPSHWPRWKAFDWGSARPYSIGYYAMDSDGVIYRYRELYGWGGKPNVGTGETYDQICNRMDKLEADEVRSGIEFWNNPADHNIWTNQGYEKDLSELFIKRGYVWNKAPKGPGSIKNGLQIMKEGFKAGRYLITSDCEHFWRTVPNLQVDENDWEIIDTDGEDHVCDEFRYSVTSRHLAAEEKREKVMKKTSSIEAADQRYAHLRG